MPNEVNYSLEFIATKEKAGQGGIYRTPSAKLN
jgi:hypothetical protein